MRKVPIFATFWQNPASSTGLSASPADANVVFFSTFFDDFAKSGPKISHFALDVGPILSKIGQKTSKMTLFEKLNEKSA